LVLLVIVIQLAYEPPEKWLHPPDLGASDVLAFLTHLATLENVAAATQNQSFLAG